MIKRLVIGDIHGDFNAVKNIYNLESPDIVIILGDYVDSFDISKKDIHKSWEDLKKLRYEHIKQYGEDSFILLLGNHDLHYIVPNERYSGHNWETARWAYLEFQNCLEKNIIKKIYIDNINKTIYSHAGVTNHWLNDICRGCPLDMVETLSLDKFIFESTVKYNCYGDTVWNGPLWVRPNSLLKDLYKDEEGVIWNQVVGHTHMKKVFIESNDNYKVTFIDTLPYQYLVETLNDEGKIINSEVKDYIKCLNKDELIEDIRKYEITNPDIYKVIKEVYHCDSVLKRKDNKFYWIKYNKDELNNKWNLLEDWSLYSVQYYLYNKINRK